MKHDIIIIGAGAAGLNIASFTNKIGLKVLLIDKTDKNIGGDCLNFGCVPSKALIHLSKLVHNSKESEKFGLKVSGKVDMKKVRNYIRSKQEIIRKHENASYLIKKGIDVVLGEARFNSENSVVVNKKEYFGKKIIIATGGKPRKLKTKGVEKVKVLTNEEIFDLTELPRKLLIIGGGPIGIEIGQTMNRLGSKVVIVQRGGDFLPKEIPEITEILFKRLKKEGIEFYFNSVPEEFVTSKSVIIKNKKGQRKVLRFDSVFAAVGRELNFPEGLEKANIKIEGNKIIVDESLRTTNKNIFVSGDALGSYQFTHATELHAKIIINNLLSPVKKKINYDNFSWVTYTDPEIATFGLNEEQLKKREIKYEKLVLNLNDNDRAIVDENIDGKSILYISKNKILGGTMIASNAGELIQELILANSAKLNINQLFNKIYPYPTASRVNKEIISKYLIKNLSSFKKKVLKRLY